MKEFLHAFSFLFIAFSTMASQASLALEELENVDLPAADKPTRIPLVGTTYYDHVSGSDTAIINKIVAATLDTTTWSYQGCEYTFATNDFLPVIEVNNCGNGDYKTEITKVKVREPIGI